MRYFVILLLSSVVFGRLIYHDYGGNTLLIRNDGQPLKDRQPRNVPRELSRRTSGMDENKFTSHGPSESLEDKAQLLPGEISRDQERTVSKHTQPNTQMTVSQPPIRNLLTFSVEEDKPRPGSKTASKNTPKQVARKALRQLKSGCQKAANGACKVMNKIGDALIENASTKAPPPPGIRW